jgi:predicted MFS family arabinose efflux permease
MPYATLIIIGIVTFLLISGEGLVRPFFNLYLDAKLTMPLSQIGVVFALAQVLPILSTLAAPWLLARWGVSRSMMAVGLANAASLLFIALISTQAAAATGYIVFMAVVPIAAVVAVVFSQEIVEARWRTVASMAYTIGLAFGLGTYAGLGGILITRFGYSALFFTGAFLALLMVALIWGYLRSIAQSKSQEGKPVTTI